MVPYSEYIQLLINYVSKRYVSYDDLEILLQNLEELSIDNKQNILVSFLTLTSKYDIINAFLCILKEKMESDDFNELLDNVFKLYIIIFIKMFKIS
jgi:hypothetical protein